MAKEKARKVTRRFFFGALGKGSILVALLAEAIGAIKAFIPKVLYESPSKFKIGFPDDIPEGITFLSENKLYIFREGDDFYAISAVCTHLYCIVDWKPDRKEFYCSCHGSIFSKDGINLTGPAPRPLPWYPLSLAPDGNLVIDSSKQVSLDYRFSI
ncbi:MAG: Rieske 2Fe-2S domain-containing protein [Candidatus Aminicenantes bacterium]|nr:Rieske 2Fe-2S domain-containing protein [Candidatus Aminicenantes bacterium]